MKLPEHLLIFSKHKTSALTFYHIVNAQYTPDGYHLRDTWLVLLSVQPCRRVSINFIAWGVESMLVLEMFPSLCLHWSEQMGELLTKSQSVHVLPHITPRVNGRVQQGRKWLSSNQDDNTHTTDSFLPQGTKSEFLCLLICQRCNYFLLLCPSGEEFLSWFLCLLPKDRLFSIPV